MAIRFLDDAHFEIDGYTFEYGYRFGEDTEPSSPTAAFVWKHRYQVACYEELLAGRPARNVVELGIHRGGSAIFLDRLLRPERLVAVDLAPRPASALTHYVETHGRRDAVRAHYGVDQGDKERIAAILDEAFGDEPIDLVIDDASHVYSPTVASFEAIFPRLRPGALYVVEDWDAFHELSVGVAAVFADPNHPAYAAMVERLKVTGFKPRLELGRFAMQATLLAAGTRDLVREVRVRHNWIVIERGAGALPPAPLRLADIAVDRFHVLSSPEGLEDAVLR